MWYLVLIWRKKKKKKKKNHKVGSVENVVLSPAHRAVASKFFGSRPVVPVQSVASPEQSFSFGNSSVVVSPAHERLASKFFSSRSVAPMQSLGDGFAAPQQHADAGFSFGNSFSAPAASAVTEGFSMSMVPAAPASSASGWKCACCETENESSAATCNTCLVPKPAAAAAKTAAPKPASIPKAGAAAGVEGFSSFPASSGSVSGSSFSAPAAVAPSATVGFSMSMAPATPASGSGADWKCACCEAENDSGSSSCSVCLVPNPAGPAKTVIASKSSSNAKPAETFASSSAFSAVTGFSMSMAPAAPASTTSGWKCACCEAENESSASICNTCLVPKPAAAPAKTFAPKPASVQKAGGGFSASSFSAPPAAIAASSSPSATVGFSMSMAPAAPASTSSGWKCACCEAENESGASTCNTCLVPKPVGGPAKTATAKPAPTPKAAPKAADHSFSAPFSAPATVGFSMSLAPVAPTTGSGAGWKCACCEAENDSGVSSCGVCLVPKPGSSAKNVAKGSEPAFVSAPFASEAAAAGSDWVCEVCESSNERSVERCSVCKVARKFDAKRLLTPKPVECSLAHKQIADR
jgi:hypothetical protein